MVAYEWLPDFPCCSRLLGRYAGTTPLFTNGYSAVGLLTSRLDASGSHGWIYDARNRVTTHATPVGTLYYGYDACGNQTNLSSASTSGVSVGYAYNAINQFIGQRGQPSPVLWRLTQGITPCLPDEKGASCEG